MALTKNTFVGGEIASADEMNTNFAEIYSALSAFPTADTALRDDAVATSNIAANAVTLAKIADAVIEVDAEGGGSGSLSSSDSALPTSLAVKNYIDTVSATLFKGYGGTASSGGSSSSFTIVKMTDRWGDSDFADGLYTVPSTGTYKAIAVATYGMYAGTTLGIEIRQTGSATEEASDSYVNGPYTTPNVEYQQSVGVVGAFSCVAGDKIALWSRATGSSNLKTGDRTILTIYRTT
jgi:hypothetical protein